MLATSACQGMVCSGFKSDIVFIALFEGFLMSAAIFTLSYSGGASDDHVIDFYDVAQALIGFQRSLALTTHLVLNDKVITQAPALKGARILALPPEDGSWKITAAVIVGLYTVGTAPKDSPIGNLIASAYDYVVSETLGFHVDFDKTLGQQYDELKKMRETELKRLPQARFDSVIEKCELAIRDMHRPIAHSETAISASIFSQVGSWTSKVQQELDINTYEYLSFTREEDRPETFVGRVSSYNINTYKGRIYLRAEGRPVPFELGNVARDLRSISLITNSLVSNARDRMSGEGEVALKAYKRVSKSGKMKGLLVVDVNKATGDPEY
ncbi:DUF7946 domain-containing protein [Pannonibacter sp. SL95]|uniref:DUF7946 domain-containing protein n=1 Tax=Pannonibacter sp. SL95 TaxID=2995153 RepID=UPI00227587B7|nr:hypothetical protein [Pannonibacter sp. SL95]MCY1705201.1 hypothetical protein [Pannonibacter sp. SL95]